MALRDDVHRLLVAAEEDHPLAKSLAFIYRRQAAIQLVRARTADEAVAEARTRQPEVAVVHLCLGGEHGVATAIRLVQVAPFCEVVLFTGGPHGPEAEAARAVGVTRVVEAEALCTWLRSNFTLAAERVRLRRRMAVLEAELMPLPTVDSGLGPGRVTPLPAAETRLRVTQVRALLAKTGSRAAAAAEAGISYSSLCAIMTRHGITDVPDDDAASARPTPATSRGPS